MNQSLLAVAAVVSLASLSSSAVAEEDKPAVKSLPASLALIELDSGKAISKADLAGGVVVLQFFASWCVGCGEVMGKLAPEAAALPKVRFLPVSVDETVADAKGYFSHQTDAVKSLRAAAAHDPEAKLAATLGIRAVPSIVIVGADGAVRGMFSGHPDATEMKKIKSLMAP